MRRSVLLLSATAVALTPAMLVAQSSARYLDQREVAEAQRQHPELVAEFGGAETGSRAAYVESVGRRVAAYTGVVNSTSAFRFTRSRSTIVSRKTSLP